MVFRKKGGILPFIRAIFLVAVATVSAASAEDLSAILPPGAQAKRAATGFIFTEGPVWKDGALVFSDTKADKIQSLDATGQVAIVRQPANRPNGNALDRQGRLVTCEVGTRRVVRQNTDGTVEIIASSYQGHPLNAPNDVVVKSDGSIWFSDPTYGMNKAPEEQSARGIYRWDPATKTIQRVAEGFDQPNGLCFSPDEKILYVGDSGKTRKNVSAFPVRPDGTLGERKLFATIPRGVPDGMRCDRDGRLYVAIGGGVEVLSPDGTALGVIALPEIPANLCFSGSDGHLLNMTARTSIYTIPVLTSPAL